MKKFAGLEICRFICAFAVIVAHYQLFFVQGVVISSIPFTERVQLPYYYLISQIYEHGDIAVQVFWVISGFIFFWKYGEHIYERSITPAAFFIWRFSRLYPLHFLTLVVVVLMQNLYLLRHDTNFSFGSNDWPHFFMQLGLASNWLNRQPYSFNGPIWSISAEILVYLFFFIAVRFMKPTIFYTIIVIAIASLVHHFYPARVVSCVIFFFSGGFVQQIIMRLGDRHQKIAFWSAIGVIITSIVAIYEGSPITGTSLIFLASGFVAAFSLVDSAIGLDLSKCVPLGALTYSSYLLHFPLQLAAVLVVDALGISRSIFFSSFVFLSFLIIIFGLAWIAYCRFEMPAQNAIRTLWLARRSKPAPA